MNARIQGPKREIPTAQPGGAGEPAAKFRLRPMEKKDLPVVLGIEVRSFSFPWTEAAYLRELNDIPFSRLLVVELLAAESAPNSAGTLEPAIVGYGCWWNVKGECHITNVTASPDARRQGVAKFLMRGILQDALREGATRATLEVRVSNQAAISLYEYFGFTSIAMRKEYYPDNREDALVMWRSAL